MYADADAAALYDLLNPWGPSDDFYLSYVIDAPSVLDVGCGTGTLLHRARECGHTGRLCGLDPDAAALQGRAGVDVPTGAPAGLEGDVDGGDVDRPAGGQLDTGDADLAGLGDGTASQQLALGEHLGPQRDRAELAIASHPWSLGRRHRAVKFIP